MKPNLFALTLLLFLSCLAADMRAANEEAQSYWVRGYKEQEKQDFEGAISDYTRAIETFKKNPDGTGSLVLYVQSLAELKQRKGDYKGALDDYTQEIRNEESSPKPSKWMLSQLYYACGIVRYTAGDLNGALGDLQKFVDLPVADPGRDFAFNTLDDAQLKLWIIRTKNNKKAEADKELSDYLEQRTGKPSIYNNNGRDVTVPNFAVNAKYLLDRISETDFRKSTGQDWYFAGMKHLLAGDKQWALDCFRKYPYGAGRPGQNQDEAELERKFPEIKALAQ